MSIEEVLDDLGVEYLRSGHHHCRPGWIQLDCPFCGKNTQRYHLGWNLSLNYANCWKCGGHHPVSVLISLGINHQRARQIAGGLMSEDIVKHERPRISLHVPAGICNLLPPHCRYLRSRGFDPKEVARIWNVQGIGIAHRLSWRLFIPIVLNQEVVSWTTRTIGTKATRYISASAEQEKINHKHLVYGEDYCRHSIIIVEGPADAWRVGPGAGALFGTAYTTAQIKRLIQHPYRYIVFDSSKDAQNRAEELADQLSVFEGTTEVVELDAEDPGSADPKEIKRLRRMARL